MRRLVLVVALLSALAPCPALAEQRATRVPAFEYVSLGQWNGRDTWAAAINDRGVVAGTATVSGSMSGIGFIWTGSGGFTAIAPDAMVWDINNKGQVVGRYRCSTEIDCAAGFIWSRSAGLQDLGDFLPYAVNDRGSMAGTCGNGSVACAMIDGGVIQLGVSPSGDFAFDINDHDVVAGWAYRPTNDGGRAPLAFTWSLREGVIMLDPADADDTIAYAINNRGVVAGSVTYNGVNARINAAAWSRGELTILQGRDWTTARGMNDRGWTVGYVSMAGASANMPMLWTPGSAPIQLSAPDAVAGFAFDINKSGQIVGFVHTTSGMRAVVWRMRSGHQR